MRPLQYPIGIIGAGAWGTALATVMQQAHGDALIWAHEAEVVQSINTDRRNDRGDGGGQHQKHNGNSGQQQGFAVSPHGGQNPCEDQ